MIFTPLPTMIKLSEGVCIALSVNRYAFANFKNIPGHFSPEFSMVTGIAFNLKVRF